ncbi:hypothetical protein [Nocardioides sp. LS1]|uniref:hypothetical protein n=1 Tax=Nocardioides sp. LS1 TaxID=1027620 RepID=UPI000F62692C|nr:hypothetical protein [Nocardioides sp. LS1]GCD91485.1 hypothetical protein NLS1_34910 [Nocardioides sp. LS1]
MSINAHAYSDPHPAPGDVPDSSPAAARLLEMTARETDQWRSEARSEAATIVAGARDEAAELVRAAREEAEALVASARKEAAQTLRDARAEASRVQKETTASRERHEGVIADLQQAATEHREKLREHLTDMLDRVDSAPVD